MRFHESGSANFTVLEMTISELNYMVYTVSNETEKGQKSDGQNVDEGSVNLLLASTDQTHPFSTDAMVQPITFCLVVNWKKVAALI